MLLSKLYAGLTGPNHSETSYIVPLILTQKPEKVRKKLSTARREFREAAFQLRLERGGALFVADLLVAPAGPLERVDEVVAFSGRRQNRRNAQIMQQGMLDAVVALAVLAVCIANPSSRNQTPLLQKSCSNSNAKIIIKQVWIEVKNKFTIFL